MTDDEIRAVAESHGYPVESITHDGPTVVLMRCPCGRLERAETGGVFNLGRFEKALQRHSEALRGVH